MNKMAKTGVKGKHILKSTTQNEAPPELHDEESEVQSETESEIWNNVDMHDKVCGVTGEAPSAAPPGPSAVAPPAGPAQRRLSATGSLNLSRQSSFRQRIAESIRIDVTDNMSSTPCTRDPTMILRDDDLIVHQQSGRRCRPSSFVAQLIVSVTLLVSALALFFSMTTNHHSRHNSQTILGAITTNEAAILALSLSVILVPVGLLGVWCCAVICHHMELNATTISVFQPNKVLPTLKLQ
jgi:hypothetical protein